MSDYFQLENDAPARRILYVASILLIVVPFAQVGSQLWPLQLGNIQWRFSAANVLSAAILLPFVGLAMIMLVARGMQSRLFSLIVGAIAGVICLVLFASIALFSLDALQLKTIVQSRALEQFNITVIRVLALTTLFAVGSLFVALAGLRAPKTRLTPAKGGSAASRKSEDAVTLIVGQASQPD